ncbi:tetratricopeptide repeat protein [Phytohabitans rumicis]|uniref:Uncharacterized protein n=1 Tax=Phytohabitans rumicis TaxID=1076125 RepID=A0A6V8KWT6_9ACTN|nr:tetratricopeptide repeat protein [Phytohabitans rumicis]GFJ86871.1 hypothetical protein Prum_005130 [Phytohabitans rumicis]
MSDAAAGETLRRALHLAGLGRVDDAVPLVQRVLADEPGNVDAFQVLAYCMQVGRRYEEMLAVAGQAVAVAPDHPALHRQMAQALVGLGRGRQAADAARQAQRLDPDDVRSELVLAEALLTAGGTKNILAAAAATTRARHLAPEDMSVYVGAGDVQLRMCEFDRARAAYRHALSLEPDSPAAQQRLAALDASRGLTHRALSTLGDTVHAAPTDPEALRTATLGIHRLLWLLTGAACVPLLATAILVLTWRDLVGGGAGVAGALATVTFAIGGVVAFGRWRLRRLPRSTRALIRVNLRRRPVSTALVRPLSMALGVLLLALAPRSGPTATLVAVALGLTIGPLLLLVLDARALVTVEAYFLIRRLWFRLLARRAAAGRQLGRRAPTPTR